MNSDDRKSVVRGFCEDELVSWYKTGRSLSEFYQDLQIASLRVPGMGGGGDVVEIQKIHQDVPQNISDSFDRHFLYSQYVFNDLYFLKISVQGNFNFILLIQGLIDDGWDNSGRWLEIFDEQGNFIDAGWFGDRGISWKGSPLGDGDFNGAQLSGIDNEQPMWSEKILAQYAVSIEQEGAKTRYIMP